MQIKRLRQRITDWRKSKREHNNNNKRFKRAPNEQDHFFEIVSLELTNVGEERLYIFGTYSKKIPLIKMEKENSIKVKNTLSNYYVILLIESDHDLLKDKIFFPFKCRIKTDAKESVGIKRSDTAFRSDMNLGSYNENDSKLRDFPTVGIHICYISWQFVSDNSY